MERQQVDLAWYLSEEIGPDSELGLKSGHEAFEAQCLCGAGSGSDPMGTASAAHDRAIASLPAAARFRAIASIFRRLAPEHQEVLVALHAPLRPWLRASLTPRFRELAGVVLVLAGRERALALATHRLDENQRTRVAELLEQADQARAAAWQAFNVAVDAHRAELAAQRAQRQRARVLGGVDTTAKLEGLLERLRGAA